MLAQRKPTSAAGKRYLETKEAQVQETGKSGLFLKSMKSSEIANAALKDLYALKKPGMEEV